MKKALLFFILLSSITLTAQNDPVLIIDNVNTTFKTGVSLPYWLKAGQTVDLGTNSKSASVLEFTVDSNNLVFSQAISLTTAQTVPVNKVWKIEGIGVTTQNTVSPSSIGLSSSGSSSSSTSNLPTIFQSPKKFETPGTYSWTVPPGVTSICVEVWGAGGGGLFGDPNYDFYGGAGGGYSYQCFTVVPGNINAIIIGDGGTANGIYSADRGNTGGTSSFGSLISATGGTGGSKFDGGIGGVGNFSNGGIGTNGNPSGGYGGTGGKGGNGGNGGNGGTTSNAGQSPGGGGGPRANGARGQVIIYW